MPHLQVGGDLELSYKTFLIHLLDRPGGRFLLGKIATDYVRRLTGDDLEIAFTSGLWTHRADKYFFPDGPKFNYNQGDFGTWKGQMERLAADTNDFWLQHYRPQAGDVVVDVGAGRGEDSITFSRLVGATGRVIAIEAHPGTFAILESFCKLNALTNVARIQTALMDEPGTVRIAESESSWMENAVRRDGQGSGVQVRASTLEGICEQQKLKDIAFLKMNIEGAEVSALLGMRGVMPRIRQICVACHDFRSDLGDGEQFRTRGFVEQFLTGYGFTLASRAADPRSYVRDHVFGIRVAGAPSDSR